MNEFLKGVLRHAGGGSQMSAASDLVNRTLARHGLTGGNVTAEGTEGALSQMMARLHPKPSGAGLTIPEGALLQDDSFTCAAGTRRFLTYAPASVAAEKGAVQGMVVMLHGCTQTPEDFATGTGMNTLAESHRLIVVYPQQSRGDNAQSCWNWFSRGDQQRDRGEPSIIAGITQEVAARHQVPGDRIFVAGLSAGGAMAAIMGQAYPDLYSAVGVHSGLPVGAARDVASAFAAMGQGSDLVMKAKATRMIVFHGNADATVNPTNGDALARLALDPAEAQSLQADEHGQQNGRDFQRRTTFAPDGSMAVEHWTIEGLGHAWSGGDAAGSYADPKGPDASAEMVRFFLALPVR
ncbi:alpha/beta hydrolase family esterase [Paracoccus indicus]|uniref:extracellular catalytic domain type 1 short-chain-length polyhydroxyalkanoate depolymerase n=1 Tax=Paracoccus indicus TaxID=2079229 RepID=UPI000D3A8AD7|nr:PHB depolymerase family esterase [Paracoccus indicus]